MSNTTVISLFALVTVFSMIWVVVAVRTATQRPPGNYLAPRTRVLIGVLGAATLVIAVLLVIEGIHRLSQT